ncbi:hypothetical protein PENSPDRAFT_450715 [Peniophora sp. CONT]|nr:hypothetical protein PENSPDRAFT_450715 [Peniophora sp. CONT]
MLLGLPEEILLTIILNLPCYRDILRCSETCQRLRALIAASGAVQHRIELGRCGMIEGFGASALQESTKERAKLLRDTISKRRSFQPTLVRDLGITQAQNNQAFALLDGIYVRSTIGPLDVPSPASDEPISQLYIRDVSGDCADPPKVTLLDILALDINIAPSLDLIVLLAPEPNPGPFGDICLHIHLRTLSSGGTKSHPRATMSVLPFTYNEVDIGAEEERHIFIDGDIVAVYIRDCQLEIYRWTNGQHLVHWRCRSEGRFIGAFSLISPTCFVIGHSGLGLGHIAVYPLPQGDTHDRKRLEISDAHVEAALPRLRVHQHTSVTRIFDSPPRSPRGALEAASRICVMQVTVEEVYPLTDRIVEDVPEADLTYVIRHDLFERLLLDHLSIEQTDTVKVGWDIWGPNNTRLLDVKTEDLPDVSVSSGSRFFSRRIDNQILNAEDGTILCSFYCFDFGDVRDPAFLLDVRNDQAHAGPYVHRVFTSGDDQPVRGIYTHLPYYAIETRVDDFKWTNVLVDGNRIICIRTTGSFGPAALAGSTNSEHVYDL